MKTLLEGKRSRHRVCRTGTGVPLVLHSRAALTKIDMCGQLPVKFVFFGGINRVARIRCVAGQNISSLWHGVKEDFDRLSRLMEETFLITCTDGPGSSLHFAALDPNMK